jgi:Mrp family chromosome partitioning ATPase
LPIAKPAPPRPRSALVSSLGGRHRQRLAQRLVAAVALVDVDGVQVGLVDALEEKGSAHARLRSPSGLANMEGA